MDNDAMIAQDIRVLYMPINLMLIKPMNEDTDISNDHGHKSQRWPNGHKCYLDLLPSLLKKKMSS